MTPTMQSEATTCQKLLVFTMQIVGQLIIDNVINIAINKHRPKLLLISLQRTGQIYKNVHSIVIFRYTVSNKPLRNSNQHLLGWYY